MSTLWFHTTRRRDLDRCADWTRRPCRGPPAASRLCAGRYGASVPTSQPTYAQLAALTAYAPQSVPTAFEDINGHMNVRHYLGIASEGLDESLTEVGIPQVWATSGHAMFSAEHHLTYLSELRTGDRISVRVRLIGRSARAAHVVVYLLDESAEKLSAVMEEVFLHMDLGTRRTAEWPEDVASQLDARIAEHEALDWKPTLSGSMTLR